jgi:hypothetical protein
MLDPDFWKDHYIAALTRDERLFLIGCINNGDDEGRLEGHPAYLKAAIFMYDDDVTTAKMGEIKESCLQKMATWPNNHQYKILPYQNSGKDCLFFPNWADQQKPSHPTKSKLPPPPPEMLPIFSSVTPETHTKPSREPPSQSSLGQSSLVKVSIGKGSVVLEDFTKFLDSEKDLTDFLTTTLENYLPRGPMWLVEVLQKLWTQAIGERLGGPALEVTLTAVKEYPPPVLAIAYAKAVKYKGGKYDTAKYLQKILKEKAEEYAKRNRSP